MMARSQWNHSHFTSLFAIKSFAFISWEAEFERNRINKRSSSLRQTGQLDFGNQATDRPSYLAKRTNKTTTTVMCN